MMNAIRKLNESSLLSDYNPATNTLSGDNITGATITASTLKTTGGKTIMAADDEYSVMDMTNSFDSPAGGLVSAAATSMFAAGTVGLSFPVGQVTLPYTADLRAFAVTLQSAVVGSAHFDFYRGASILATLTLASGATNGYATYGIGSVQMSAGNTIGVTATSATAIASGARIDTICRKR